MTRRQDVAVREAFADGVYPGDDGLVADPEHCPECREVQAAFEGRDWRSLDSPAIQARKDALPLLIPEAQRYYLPAYLLACLEAREEVDTAWDSVITYLAPPRAASGTNREEFERRASAFDARQRQAIRRFLEDFDEREKAFWDGGGNGPPEEGLARALEFWSSPHASELPRRVK